jgi:hypothetical protein
VFRLVNSLTNTIYKRSYQSAIIISIVPKPAAPFNLTVNGRLELESWCRTNTLSQHLAQRARILFFLNEGETPKGISGSLLVSTQTAQPQ